MPRISKKRIEKYKKLADRGLWDINDDKFRAFYDRALQEDVELVSNNFQTTGMFRAPHRKSLDGVDIALIGVPMDIGVPNPRPGTRLASQAVRYWSLDRNMVHYATRVCPFDACSIVDWGDIEFQENIYSLDGNLEELYGIYANLQKTNVTPLSIGGEHTGTYGFLRGLTLDGEEPVGLIHLDAHADTSVGFGGSRLSDATLFQCAAVDGLIDPERTIQIGLRGRGLPRCDFSYDSGMRVVLADELQEKGTTAIAEEIRRVVGDGPCYLTIDTDVFDCAIMPGTTLPEPFGLTSCEVRDLIRSMRGLDLIGADLMELSPPFDPTGQSACLAAGIAFEMLCLLAETRHKRNGESRPTHWNIPG